MKKDKSKQNSNGISSTAKNFLLGCVVRGIFRCFMDDVLGLGEVSEQLIDWLREFFEEDQF